MRRRAIVSALAVLALAYAGAGAVVRAADPPATLGGTLGATREVVVMQSSATVPVRVELSMPEGWEAAEASFILNPGDRHTVAILRTGDDGRIVVRMVAVDVPDGADAAALVLSLGTPKPDIPLPLWPFVGTGLLAAALALVGALHWRRRRLEARRYRMAIESRIVRFAP